MGTPKLDETFSGTDRYRLEERIGSGGMGVVYRARDAVRGKVVALKTLDRVSPASIFQLKEEFRAIAEFSHPNVVVCHELVRAGPHWFFTMELVDGLPFANHVWDGPIIRDGTSTARGALTTVAAETLFLDVTAPSAALTSASAAERSVTWQRRVTPRPADSTAGVLPLVPAERDATPVCDMARLRDVVAQLADGLTAIHGAGMLHCDIKPSNVLVTPDGNVTILDFGIAQAVNSAQKDLADRERPKGTPTYMSPEQGLAAPLTPATDSYAVGAMLYEALTGELPFDGAAIAILLAKQSVLPPRPSDLKSGIPDDLDDLVMRLLSIDPRRRPSTTEIMALFGHQSRSRTRGRTHDTGPGHTGRGVRALFESRAAEAAQLEHAFELTASGAPCVVHVSGLSGMGKSSLLSRFAETLEGRPETVVLRGRSYERESVPFNAFDTVVDGITRYLLRLPPAELARVLPPHLDELMLVFPVLRAVLDQGGPAEPDRPEAPAPEASARQLPAAPHVLQRRAFDAFARLIQNLTHGRRLVIVMDDLHWGDTDSARLLEHWLSGELPDALVVLGYRRDPRAAPPGDRALLATLEGLRGRAPRGGQTITIDLGELGATDAFDVAVRLLRERGRASTDTAREIAAASGGHPFFLDELVEHAQRRSEARDGRADAPTSIDEALRSRVAALDPGARRLIEVLSIARRPLDVEVLIRAAGDADESDLGALRAARLATTFREGERTLVHTTHDRLREIVAAAIGQDEARAHHAALAAALSAAAETDEEALAVHLLAGGRRAEGRAHALRAAAAAERGLAFLRAAALYREVLALDGTSAAPGLHKKLADALSNGGRGKEAGLAYLDGARASAAERPLDRAARVDLLRLAAEHLLKSGHGDDGVAVLKEALAEVGLRYPTGRAEAAAAVLWRRTRLDVSILARRPRAAAWRARVTAAGRTQIARERADVTYGPALGLQMFDVVRGAALGYLNLDVALASGDPPRICRALSLAAAQAAATGLGGRDRAERFLSAAHDVARDVTDPYTLALPRLADGNLRFFMGEWRAALRSFEEADAVLRENCLGVFWETTTARYQAINCLIFLGDLKVAAARVGPVVAEALERSDEYALKNTLYPRAIAAIVAGDPARGRAAVEQHQERYSGGYTGGRWGALIAAATLDRYEGDADLALARIERDENDMKRAMLFEVEMIRVFTRYEHALSALAAAGGRRGRPAATAERIGRELLAERPAYARAMGHKVLGAALSLQGDRSGALDHVGRAIAGLETCGLRYLAACARWRRAELARASGTDDAAMAASYFEAQGVADAARCVATSYPGVFA